MRTYQPDSRRPHKEHLRPLSVQYHLSHKFTDHHQVAIEIVHRSPRKIKAKKKTESAFSAKGCLWEKVIFVQQQKKGNIYNLYFFDTNPRSGVVFAGIAICKSIQAYRKRDIHTEREGLSKLIKTYYIILFAHNRVIFFIKIHPVVLNLCLGRMQFNALDDERTDKHMFYRLKKCASL